MVLCIHSFNSFTFSLYCRHCEGFDNEKDHFFSVVKILDPVCHLVILIMVGSFILRDLILVVVPYFGLLDKFVLYLGNQTLV